MSDKEPIKGKIIIMQQRKKKCANVEFTLGEQKGKKCHFY